MGCVGSPTSPPPAPPEDRRACQSVCSYQSGRRISSIEARRVIARMGTAGEMVEGMTASQLASLS